MQRLVMGNAGKKSRVDSEPTPNNSEPVSERKPFGIDFSRLEPSEVVRTRPESFRVVRSHPESEQSQDGVVRSRSRSESESSEAMCSLSCVLQTTENRSEMRIH